MGDLRLLQDLLKEQDLNDVLWSEVQLKSLQVVAFKHVLKLIELS